MGKLSAAQLQAKAAAAARRADRDMKRKWPENRSDQLRYIDRSEYHNKLVDFRFTRHWLNCDLNVFMEVPSNAAMLSVLPTQEDHVYLCEVRDALTRLNGYEQAMWFLENCEDCEGSKDRSDQALSRMERAQRSKMRVRLKEELGES